MSDAKNGNQQHQDNWLALAKATADKLAALEAAVQRPLPEEDIRSRQGKGYLSGGDILLNLLKDFGPFAYETTIKRLEWTPPREDRRQREVNKKTGEIVYDTGYTCVGVAVVTLILTLPDGRKIVREGSGTCGSDMQQSPEAAIENAVKGAETDALKRACVGIGPRYGLALRFNDRDDDRQALGLVERNKKLDEARRLRDENKTPKGAGPEKPPEASVAGASPATHTPATMPSLAAKATQAADDAARRDALRKAEIPADVLKARKAAAVLATEIHDVGLCERAVASLMTARTLEQVAITRGGIEKIIAKEKVKAGEKSPAPTGAAPDGPGSVGAEAARGTQALKASPQSDVDDRRLQAGLRLMQEDFDPALATALQQGGHPGDLAGFDDLGCWPPDPQEGDLHGHGWSAKGASPSELVLIHPGDPVPQPLQSSVISEAVRRLGREAFAGVWKGLGGPSAGGLCSGFQLRLIAFVVAYKTQAVGAEAK